MNGILPHIGAWSQLHFHHQFLSGEDIFNASAMVIVGNVTPGIIFHEKFFFISSKGIIIRK